MTQLLNVCGWFDEAVDLVGVDVFQIMAIDLHEGIFENLPGSYAFFRFLMKQLLEEKSGRRADVVRKLKLIEPDGIV